MWALAYTLLCVLYIGNGFGIYSALCTVGHGFGIYSALCTVGHGFGIYFALCTVGHGFGIYSALAQGSCTYLHDAGTSLNYCRSVSNYIPNQVLCLVIVGKGQTLTLVWYATCALLLDLLCLYANICI